jgi:hypothetical protein
VDLKLTRNSFEESGVYSTLTANELGSIWTMATLEHAYPGTTEPVSYIAKIPPGVYPCVRGMHKLADEKPLFETFEITGVAGHSGLLFHVGNTNGDSEGCVLLGMFRQLDMIMLSKIAFDKFMTIQEGITQFQLTVE